MVSEPTLLALQDLEILLPEREGFPAMRAHISVRILAETAGPAYFDLDEIAEMIRAHEGAPFVSYEQLVRDIRTEVEAIEGVLSSMVSIRVFGTYQDVSEIRVSTLPNPKHAVLFSLLG